MSTADEVERLRAELAEARNEAETQGRLRRATHADFERQRTRADGAEAGLRRAKEHVADLLFASCICDRNPETTDGPEEDCPVHGTDEHRPLALRAERDVLATQMAAIRTLITEDYGADYDDEDVPAAVERLMRHLSEHEANVQRILQAKSEAIERAQTTCAATPATPPAP